MTVSVQEFCVLASVLFAAACLQGSVGFGLRMIAAPVTALIDPSLLPATLVLLSVVLTLTITVRERQHLDLRGAGWALGRPLSGQYRRGLAGHRASRRESGLAGGISGSRRDRGSLRRLGSATLKRNLTAAGAARILRGHSSAHRSAVAAARLAAPATSASGCLTRSCR